MNGPRLLLISSLLALSCVARSQVPVRLEPRHKNVLENSYLRLLDVHINPGDTTQFHVHATPSFFLILTTTLGATQLSGQDWTKTQNVAGQLWYRSFLNDTLVHRVTNCDTVPFHVRDLEILKAYMSTRPIKPLPFEVLLENEKVYAYSVNRSSINDKLISQRGPIIAQLVEGDEVLAEDAKTKKTSVIKKGGYRYFEPGSSFYLKSGGDGKLNLVLLEIK